MLEGATSDRAKFFVFGFVTSLALHAACVIPLVSSNLDSPPDEPEPLVIELQGIVADTQLQQQTMEAKKGEAEKQEQKETDKQKAEEAQETPESPTQKREESKDDVQSPSPTPPTQSFEVGDAPVNVAGAKVQQNAQTIKANDDVNLIREYVKKLGKKIQSSLQAERRRASVTISFAIQSDGQLRTESLKVVESTGHSALDESALNTVRTSAPFAAPPREIAVRMVVDFDRKR